MNSLLRTLAVATCAAALAAAQSPARKPSPKPARSTARPAVASSAASLPPGKSAFDKSTLEAYVRHLFVWGPKISVTVSDPKPSPELTGFSEVNVHAAAGEATQDEKFLVSKDGRKVLRAAIYDIAQNPFKPELDKLKTQFQPSLGTPGAPVVMVIFTDFQCPFCKDEAQMLRQNLLSAYPKQVRLYFKDFPLSQIHPWAKTAAMAGRCIFRQNPASFWDYYDWVYANQ
ncbi:MAG TPA: thioredoxin domain-containing protein, partial [Bryobacteraceae bacterium]|nr:thioredoxin domain-containing protein [Bryobacteraceae bacterium]